MENSPPPPPPPDKLKKLLDDLGPPPDIPPKWIVHLSQRDSKDAGFCPADFESKTGPTYLVEVGSPAQENTSSITITGLIEMAVHLAFCLENHLTIFFPLWGRGYG
jgi:hypothetical protein